ncbi:MAG TPA: 16S rRNA (guanine(527)-N(7))-methyltransferase RsmG [Bacteroidota bacterium]|jgi:16S rRNA (guanine527-N7)-methyltransferase|nr:16S rRNA (guanine(527)-N(7))-methyltransferase RsmG [Bacteroidota bacterium]
MEVQIWFRTICVKNSFVLSDAQFEQLVEYVSRLTEWNNKVNLISRRDVDRIWERHIIPSIAFTFAAKLSMPARILDLGTGGGLPGIPLAILLPEARITLLDSIGKKIKAVEDILHHLSLENVEVVCGRAEEIGRRAEFKSSFEYVIARAVAPVVDIIKWGQPFIRRTSPQKLQHRYDDRIQSIRPGSILMLKGGNLDGEINQARRKLPSVEVFSYPIAVEGIEPDLLPDKKIVVAYP